MTKEDRWHDFAKEKPSEDMEGRNFIVSNGHYEKIATWCGYWENEPFMGDRLCDEVVRWKFYFTPEEEKANEATCKELKAYNVVASNETENYINGETNLAFEVYDADDVDELLAKKDAEIESLKASHYAENVDLEMTNKKLQDELTKLKAQMPEYKKFIEEEEFRKKLVDEYAGYVYDWKDRHYIATPYLNIFIKGILRALWLYRATTAKHLVTAYENYDYLDCQEMTIKQENARTWMTCKLRTAEEWVKVWKNVERKCRAKAEEYK